MIRPEVARKLVLIAGEFDPDPVVRFASTIMLAADVLASRRPPWWAWTSWLAAGISIAAFARRCGG